MYLDLLTAELDVPFLYVRSANLPFLEPFDLCLDDLMLFRHQLIQFGLFLQYENYHFEITRFRWKIYFHHFFQIFLGYEFT